MVLFLIATVLSSHFAYLALANEKICTNGESFPVGKIKFLCIDDNNGTRAVGCYPNEPNCATDLNPGDTCTAKSFQYICKSHDDGSISFDVIACVLNGEVFGPGQERGIPNKGVYKCVHDAEMNTCSKKFSPGCYFGGTLYVSGKFWSDGKVQRVCNDGSGGFEAWAREVKCEPRLGCLLPSGTITNLGAYAEEDERYYKCQADEKDKSAAAIITVGYKEYYEWLVKNGLDEVETAGGDSGAGKTHTPKPTTTTEATTTPTTTTTTTTEATTTPTTTTTTTTPTTTTSTTTTTTTTTPTTTTTTTTTPPPTTPAPTPKPAPPVTATAKPECEDRIPECKVLCARPCDDPKPSYVQPIASFDVPKGGKRNFYIQGFGQGQQNNGYGYGYGQYDQYGQQYGQQYYNGQQYAGQGPFIVIGGQSQQQQGGSSSHHGLGHHGHHGGSSSHHGQQSGSGQQVVTVQQCSPLGDVSLELIDALCPKSCNACEKKLDFGKVAAKYASAICIPKPSVSLPVPSFGKPPKSKGRRSSSSSGSREKGKHGIGKWRN